MCSSSLTNSRRRAAAAAHGARPMELLQGAGSTAGKGGTGKPNARSKGARDQTLVTCDANDDFVSPSLKKGGLLFL